jgi:hypothetical protein
MRKASQARQKLAHNPGEFGASDSSNRLGVRQLAAALDGMSLLVLNSAISEPGSKLPGVKAQASLRTPKVVADVSESLRFLTLDRIDACCIILT